MVNINGSYKKTCLVKRHGQFDYCKKWLSCGYVSWVLTSCDALTLSLGVEFPVGVVGKLYITGGRINGARTNQAEAIDMDGQAGTVTPLPAMQEARISHALAAAGSLLFAFGGYIIGVSLMSSCEFYDSRTNR